MNRATRFFAVILFIVVCLGISSIAEEITLTTYYPAPYGAYDELTTTGDTHLATDSGSVGIGTTGPGYKLDVQTDLVNDFIAQFKNANLSGYGVLIDVEGAATSIRPALRIDNQVGTVFEAKVDGTVNATGYEVGGVTGASGTFITADAIPKTITVVNGIITDITP